jgi:hypothetical protein
MEVPITVTGSGGSSITSLATGRGVQLVQIQFLEHASSPITSAGGGGGGSYRWSSTGGTVVLEISGGSGGAGAWMEVPVFLDQGANSRWNR